MTIRRTLYPGFQDALCPVQPPASLEWLGIFDSEGFPGRKSVRLVRPRILPSNYRRVAAIQGPSSLIPAFPAANLANIPTELHIERPPALHPLRANHAQAHAESCEPFGQQLGLIT